MSEARYLSAAYEAERVVCDRACFFKGAVILNNSGADVFVWICDAATTSPVRPGMAPLKVAAGETGSLDWELAKRKMSSGIYICASTDPYDKTLTAFSGSAGCLFEVAFDV